MQTDSLRRINEDTGGAGARLLSTPTVVDAVADVADVAVAVADVDVVADAVVADVADVVADVDVVVDADVDAVVVDAVVALFLLSASSSAVARPRAWR